jgi:hypothetical protein
MISRWVLIDETNGSTPASGERMTPAALARIAAACTLQLNGEFAVEHGGGSVIRCGDATSILPGESAYIFVPSLPVPGASAYHDIDGKGVPFAFCAVQTCATLLGQGASVSVDASHELCEAQFDPGCNRYLDDRAGTLHAYEACDAVEVQSYAKTMADGSLVYVSNFITEAWTTPNAPGPYDYMTKAGLGEAIGPPGPMQTAPGGGGNYQIECPSTTSEEQAITASRAARGVRVVGSPRKAAKVAHWSSRASRRGVRAT